LSTYTADRIDVTVQGFKVQRFRVHVKSELKIDNSGRNPTNPDNQVFVQPLIRDKNGEKGDFLELGIWILPFDLAQGGESFDFSQDREPVERLVELFVIWCLEFFLFKDSIIFRYAVRLL
jgi:hypothetical protein